MGTLPNANDVESMSEADALKYISRLCDHVHELKISKKTKEIDDMIYRLSDSYFICRKYRNQVSQIFIEKEVIKSAYYFLFILSNTRPTNDQTLDLLYTFLINFSIHSDNFARGIYSSSILAFLIDNCLEKKYLNDIKNRDNNNILVNCVNVIHNVSRNPANKLAHRVVEFKEALLSFIKHDNTSKLGVLSMLTLAYIVEEDEINMLDEGSDSVKKIFSLIKRMLETDTKQAGFSIDELMNGVRSISFNDKMKERISEIDGIPILLEIISPKSDGKVRKLITEEAIATTLAVIWNLCFIPAIKTKLIEEYQIENLLNKYQCHKYPKIVKNCKGICFEIVKGKKNVETQIVQSTELKTTPEVEKHNFDVFLSYAWENKEKIHEIKAWLEKSSMKVWIDEDQMIGSTLEAMAKGIENSKLILIGMSSSYAKSMNCRSEAEYAYRKRKPIIPLIMELKYKPESWLGFIMGMKLYFEFSNPYNESKVIQGLLKSIRGCLNCNASVETVEQKIREVNSYKQLDSWVPVLNSNKTKALETVELWSTDKVLEWLNRSNLQFLRKKFVDVDGSLLVVMVQLRLQSPDYFNETMKTEYGLKFIDVIKFHRALNDLESTTNF